MRTRLTASPVDTLQYKEETALTQDKADHAQSILVYTDLCLLANSVPMHQTAQKATPQKSTVRRLTGTTPRMGPEKFCIDADRKSNSVACALRYLEYLLYFAPTLVLYCVDSRVSQEAKV